jgi:hypothetical protein
VLMQELAVRAQTARDTVRIGVWNWPEADDGSRAIFTRFPRGAQVAS